MNKKLVRALLLIAAFVMTMVLSACTEGGSGSSLTASETSGDKEVQEEEIVIKEGDSPDKRISREDVID